MVRINDLLDPLVSIGLQARSGYIIDNGVTNVGSITSVAFPELTGIEGSKRDTPLSPTPLTSDDIDNLHSMETLSNFFDGLTPEILTNDTTSELNTLDNVFYTITLKANDGKLFRTGKEITSIEFKYNIVINITKIEPILDTPTESDLSGPDLESMTTLSKLFNLTDDDLTKITVRTIPRRVQLGTKEGYIFSNNSIRLNSAIFTPKP
ncbi:MAG: hypothetical protein ACRC7B_01215 [Metamycoplasmataceae bacterium]